MEPRLPAHLEVTALIRAVTVEGGFAAVLAKGEKEAGTILVVLAHNGADERMYERMPDLSGNRSWVLSRRQDPEKPFEFRDYLARRAAQDPDLWIVELDVAKGERFIGVPADLG